MGGCTIFDGNPLSARAITYWANVLLLTILLSGRCAYAEQSAAHGSSSIPLLHFSIKPRLCVLNAGEEVCHDELHVKWESSIVRSLCLFQRDKPDALRCWESAIRGEYQFELTASVSTDFQLRELTSDKPLSDQRFQVVYNDKKFRRARRNPWSFF